MSDDTSSHVRVSHLYDELLFHNALDRTADRPTDRPRTTINRPLRSESDAA